MGNIHKNVCSTVTRPIALIDMDCFYVQVFQRQYFGNHWHPHSIPPCVVLQYTGGCIAVDYKARKLGIRKGQFKSEILKICPEVKLFYVPQHDGKVDLTIFRNASEEVFEVICRHFSTVEKASIDEAYIDLSYEVNQCDLKFDGNDEIKDFLRQSQSVLVEGPDSNQSDNSMISLLRAAHLINNLRQDIYESLSFRCSCGISINKMLAKLCCSLNKPNGQTILPLGRISTILSQTRIENLRKFGGKLGRELRDNFGIKFVSQMSEISYKKLETRFGPQIASYIRNIGLGIDDEPVKRRINAKSLASSKDFKYKPLTSRESVINWFNVICKDLCHRLDLENIKNKRSPHSATVVVRIEDLFIEDANHLPKNGIIKSRSSKIDNADNIVYIFDTLMNKVMIDFKENIETITYIGISASNMKEDVSRSQKTYEYPMHHNNTTLHSFISSSLRMDKSQTADPQEKSSGASYTSETPASMEISFFGNDNLMIKSLNERPMISSREDQYRETEETIDQSESSIDCHIDNQFNNKIPCDECNELIDYEMFLDHKDHHLAQIIEMVHQDGEKIDFEKVFGLKQAPIRQQSKKKKRRK